MSAFVYDSGLAVLDALIDVDVTFNVESPGLGGVSSRYVSSLL